MAKLPALRSKESRARAAEKAEKLGIVNRKWPVPKGIDSKLIDLCRRHHFEDWRELIETAVQRLHESPEAAARFLDVTRHDFTISENVSRRIDAFNSEQGLINADHD